MPHTAIPTLRLSALALGVGLLAACTPAEVTPTEPMALDGTSFTVEPLPQQPCDPAQPYAVRVRWSVADWAEPKFDFHLRSNQGQLWARANEAEGESTSDPFVTPGLYFVMVDRLSRQVVAATPAPALVCPAA
jgi:hypothetical protein